MIGGGGVLHAFVFFLSSIQINLGRMGGAAGVFLSTDARWQRVASCPKIP